MELERNDGHSAQGDDKRHRNEILGNGVSPQPAGVDRSSGDTEFSEPRIGMELCCDCVPLSFRSADQPKSFLFNGVPGSNSNSVSIPRILEFN